MAAINIPAMRNAKPRSARKKRLDPKWYRESATAYEERMRVQRREYAKKKRPPRPSPVTITRADGSVSVEPPLGDRELRKITRDRPPIGKDKRRRILARDRHACRYCGNDSGPFEIDHVLPVVKGGSDRIGNLVTACRECNRRKGADVWKPNPVS